MKCWWLFVFLRVLSAICIEVCISLLAPSLALATEPSTNRLTIQWQGPDLRIDWPVTATNFVLQQTTALQTSNSWSNVGQAPATGAGTRYVILPPTNAMSFFRLFSNVTFGPDEPDDAFQDTNGDGIDGDVSRAIFVAQHGNDAGAGTMADPVRTIAEGIRRGSAAGKDVYVAAGVYASGTLTLSNGVSIYGGYSPVNWSRGGALIVNVTVPDARAVTASELTNRTTLDRLTITGGDARGGAASAYGIFAVNSPALVIRRCSLQAGSGTDGTDGAGGSLGAGGATGGQGNPGCEESGGFCSGCSRPLGGLPGTSPCGRTGGTGGQPGHAANGGLPGGTGTGGTPGGPGASCGGSTACDGVRGNDGARGADGLNGATGLEGTFSLSGYAPIPGGDGSAGGPGNGGGGGGGGGGGDDDCDSYGSSGGGGGGGGCGGTAGRRGLSAGGSFGVYLVNSSARIESCTIQTSRGGTGGNGGTGGGGGTGGMGGPGGQYGGGGEQDDGGDGAPGGRGGHGGAGAGGPSIGIVMTAGSTPQLVSLTYVVGAGGAGGVSPAGNGPAGRSAGTYP